MNFRLPVLSFLILIFVGVCWTVPRWLEFHYLQESLTRPGIEANVRSLPQVLDVSQISVPEENRLSVGYASFVLPQTTATNIWSYKNGTSIMVESSGFQLSLDPSVNSGRFSGFESMKQVEQATPVSFSSILFMKRPDMMHYFSSMHIKAKLAQKGKSYVYESDHTKGFLRVKDENTGTIVVWGQIFSGDHHPALTFTATASREDESDAMISIKTFIKSLNFTVQSIENEDQARKLISDAGIIERKDETMPTARRRIMAPSR